MNLPTCTLQLMLADPEWEPIFVEGQNTAINSDSYRKMYNVEVEIVQLNLNSGGMRVRFEWPNKHRKSGMETVTQDVPISTFFDRYEIVEKVVD